jgi:hypothetical protein
LLILSWAIFNKVSFFQVIFHGDCLGSLIFHFNLLFDTFSIFVSISVFFNLVSSLDFLVIFSPVTFLSSISESLLYSAALSVKISLSISGWSAGGSMVGFVLLGSIGILVYLITLAFTQIFINYA